VLNACGMVINGNFKGGAYFYGLKEGAVISRRRATLFPPT